MTELTLTDFAERTVEALPVLFTQMAERSPPFLLLRFVSTGYSREGTGAANYIDDGLADEALLAAYPRFVIRTANGRIFRLLPQRNSLSVEQGGAAGDGLTDDRAAIQAAIDYAAAVGAAEVRFESAHYRVDCPVRVSPLSDTRAEDGHPLVVRHSVALRGCGAVPAVLDFRGLDGSDPESNYQLVATAPGDPTLAVWRGGGIFVQGDAVWPLPAFAERRIARLELSRLVLQGNRQHTGSYAWPADPATGDGWDISDKALWMQDCAVGTIVCRDVDMIGWKGEILYLAGSEDALERLELTRCRLLTSNGSALNPGVDCRLVARDCEFGDCFQAQEDTGKTSAIYRNCLWRDCEVLALGSGPTNGVFHVLTYPTRDEAVPLPMTVLDGCTFRDAGRLVLMSWLRGTITTVDTQVLLLGGESMALRDIDLAIDAWIDRRPSFEALLFYGVDSLTDPVPGAAPGVYRQPPRQVRLRLRHFRTALAEQKGRQFNGVRWAGLIARSCRIEAEGDFSHARSPNGGENPLSMPYVAWRGGDCDPAYSPRGYFVAAPLAASGVLAPVGPGMVVEVAGAASVSMVLPQWPAGGADFGYAEGQRVRIVKQFANGTIEFAKGATHVMAMTATRTLAANQDWIEFTYNRTAARWEESGFFSAA